MSEHPTRCSIYGCRGPADVPLKAADGTFWFCAHHAPKYEALGYKPLQQPALGGTGQLELGRS